MPKQQSAAQPPTNRGRSIPEAAEVLGVGVRTVWQLVAEGRIRSVRG
jgi:hypothetical protein